MDVAFDAAIDKRALLRELMERYGQDVWNFAYALTRDADLADDVSQDVFVKAYQKIDGFRGEASVKTWLLTIARNQVADARRSAFFRRVTLVGTWRGEEQRRGAGASAEKVALGRLGAAQVWELVWKLPPKLREVLVLHAQQELATAEIAELLGVREVTVRGRLHRARLKMNEWLKEEGE